MNECRELYTVSNKEDGRVVANHIPVSFLSVELYREPSWVTRRVCRSLLTTHGREPYSYLSFLPYFAEEIGRRLYQVSYLLLL